MGTLSPVIEFIAALGVTAIIWFGGRGCWPVTSPPDP
jgi:ATP-binding cassette, subfamily B, bacterial MsbA